MCGIETCEHYVAGSVQSYCSTHHVTRHLVAEDSLSDSFFFSSGACIREGLAGFEADVGILFSLGTELGKDTA